MGRMPAEPHGAPDTTGPDVPVSTTGWPGRNGTRCSRTPIGPTPGPPPPCGMQKVLCRLRWLTSEPNRPGLARPTMALRLAPSRSEEHTSELQSRQYLVCRLLLEKKKKIRLQHS